MGSADELGRSRARREAVTTRAIAANRADPKSGKNEPSRAADRERPVVRPRGERRQP